MIMDCPVVIRGWRDAEVAAHLGHVSYETDTAAEGDAAVTPFGVCTWHSKR